MIQNVDTAAFRIAIGIATRGRAALLAEGIADLAHQTVQPSQIIVCCPDPSDVEGLVVTSGVKLVLSAPGLPVQRNVILDLVGDEDVLLFLDDDCLVAPGYLAATIAAFQADPGLVATTGTLLADDACGPGLSLEEGRALLAADRTPHATGQALVAHAYGCNMAIRMDAVRQHGLRFDERLPLYAWSEDMDFSHRLARHGRIAKLLGARGVHLGAKQGRTPGRRLGYSQVANPIYLFQKGSYSLTRAAGSVGRNIAANTARALRPEPYVDRRGRLRGNALAMLDLVRGRLDPGRILEL